MTREDQITKAAEIIAYGCSDELKAALIQDFPELAESEDERIRKALYKMAKVPRKGIYEAEGITKEQALAWLEKQKEPVVDKEGMYYYLGGKFIYCGYPATEENPYDFAMSQQEKQKGQPTNEEMLRTLRAEYEKGVADTIAKYEQKEQKPAWSEEDKTRLTNILIMLQEYVIHHYSKDDVNKSVDWLKALPERFNLQPKQEWNEEDEKIIDTIVSILGQYIDYKAVSGTGSGYATPRYSKEMDWLKSLRPQPKVE